MNRLSFYGACLMCLSATAAFGDSFFDDFQGYSVGVGVAAQSSKWQRFPGWATDALIQQDPANAANKAANITDNLASSPTYADVVTKNMSNLFTSGNKVKLSFDFYLNGSGDTYPQVNIGPLVSPGGGDYNQATGIFFNDGAAGNVEALAWIPGGANVIQLGNVSLQNWHHLDIVMDKTGSTVNLSYWVDNLPITATLSQTLTDPAGWNAIEMGTYTGDNNASTFVLIDNLSAQNVPEPSSLVLFGLGAAGVIVWVRRRRRA
jgi:hypothetical protein